MPNLPLRIENVTWKLHTFSLITVAPANSAGVLGPCQSLSLTWTSTLAYYIIYQFSIHYKSAMFYSAGPSAYFKLIFFVTDGELIQVKMFHSGRPFQTIITF
jgi:hypothetical protein